MTNQRHSDAKIFYKAKKKWKEGQGDGARVRGESERESNRRADRLPDRVQPRPSKRSRSSEPEKSEPKPPRPLPGAQPLNQCIPAFVALRKKALAYPSTYEDHAQGQTLIKLKNKSVVVALARELGGLAITCKLPRSGFSATSKFSFASPAGYGLGKQGWVQARFNAGDEVPLRMLLGWIEESYAAVAPPPRDEKPRRKK